MFILSKEKIFSLITAPLQHRDKTPKKGRRFEGLDKEKVNLILADESAWKNFLKKKNVVVTYLTGKSYLFLFKLIIQQEIIREYPEKIFGQIAKNTNFGRKKPVEHKLDKFFREENFRCILQSEIQFDPAPSARRKLSLDSISLETVPRPQISSIGKPDLLTPKKIPMTPDRNQLKTPETPLRMMNFKSPVLNLTDGTEKFDNIQNIFSTGKFVNECK
jgi:hypothetical protein